MSTSISFEYLGHKIRELRVAQNVTQKELAKKVKHSPTWLSFVERGTKFPSIETTKLIFHELGYNVSINVISRDK